MARNRLLVATALALTLVACSNSKDGKFTANGHELYLSCSGASGPTVIFEAAVGGDHSLWPIAERIRDRWYACVYDRPGNGDSPAPDKPMTARADVADLHALLEAASIPRPIVVVGHSYGGLIAYMEAIEHPDEVAGVVLVDASHPDQATRWDSLMTDQQRQIYRAPFGKFPHVDFMASLQEAGAEEGSFPEVPLTVITATRGLAEGTGCSRGLPCDEMQAIWLELQDGYAALRPDARHIETPTSHYVHDDDPDLVVDEIVRILDAVKSSPQS
jgi:pimeloyl-ACP methyl ester carboxylesterase